MSQLNFHKNISSTPPPRVSLPIIRRLIAAYKLWHEYLPHFPKTARHTLGSKIDLLFVEIIELAFTAGYLSKEQKQPYIQKAINKFDLLKFFLQIAWEIKLLDNKKYIALSEQLNEIGKMLGGWARQLQAKPNPANNNGVGK